MLNSLGAVRLNDDQLESAAAARGTGFATDESALPFVKPDHANSISLKGRPA